MTTDTTTSTGRSQNGYGPDPKNESPLNSWTSCGRAETNACALAATKGVLRLTPRQPKIVLAKLQFPHLTQARLAQRHRVSTRTIRADFRSIEAVLPTLAYLFAR